MPIASDMFNWEEEQRKNVEEGQPSGSFVSHENRQNPQIIAKLARRFRAFMRYLDNGSVDAVSPCYDPIHGGWCIAVMITPSWWTMHPSTWRIPGDFHGVPIVAVKSHRRQGEPH